MAAATTFLLSLAPGFEGRYAVVVGMALGLAPPLSIALACIGEVALAVSLATIASYVDSLLYKLSSGNGFLGRLARYILAKIASARAKAERYVRRWGALGLAIFVAVPLPVTGVWTGALVGYLLGMDRRSMAIALSIGGIASVLIVGIPAMLASTLGAGTR